MTVEQSSAPTVGDTIWVTRVVRVPQRYVVRAPDWELSGDVELLGPPRITQRGDSAELAFPLVVWLPGQRTVEVPGPVLVGPDGAVDSVRAEPVVLTVGSVLPNRPDSAIAPQPAVGLVPRAERTPVPLLVLLGAMTLVLAPVHILWRRRGRATELPSSRPVPTPALRRWAEAGELRAVAAATALRVRRAIASRLPSAHEGLDTEACIAALAARPELPVADVAELLRALDDARFAPAESVDGLTLAARADALLPALKAEAA